MSEALAEATVRPPDPDTIFRNRARRLARLAHDRPLEPFLTLVGGLAEAQHAVLSRQNRCDEGPLDASCLRTADFEALLQAFLEQAEVRGAGEGPERARRLAQGVVARASVADRVRPCGRPPRTRSRRVFLRRACASGAPAPLAAAPRPEGSPSALARTCPRCNSRPFSSVILGGAAAGARFCCCALCGTQWRYLRATCTWCGEPQALTHCHIDSHADDVSAECCDACGTYIKQFRQDRRPDLDPIADDLASFELDLTMESTRYVRRALNPLMLFDLRRAA